jgi:hypothetical protein
MKICAVGTEMIHEDGQTDLTKLIAAFRNIVNALKIEQMSESPLLNL